ncbi:hypothetical protein [Streptomyces sp. NPDC053431]|uniref:hypothetical protein n=1 Tax=Streptomyces sp. NPDC053431 TaxID=3365703 RepID=UPI0037D303CB
MNTAKIGTALIGGYVLGRTKKGKLALGVAMALAGSRVKPAQVGKTLARSPFLSDVNEQVRGELMTAGKAAATTVLNAKAGHLADTLHDRTAGLRGGQEDTEERTARPRDEESASDDDRNEASEKGGEGGAGKAGSRRTSSSSRGGGAATKKTEGAKRTEGAKKSESKRSDGAKSEAGAKRSTQRTSASGGSGSSRSGGGRRRDDD